MEEQVSVAVEGRVSAVAVERVLALVAVAVELYEPVVEAPA